MALGDRGEVAVVIGVGASRGLGAALARRFASEGLHVFVAGRTSEKIEAVAQEIRDAGGDATAIVTDATDPAQLTALLDRAQAEGGSLDCVIYNAGNNRFASILDMDDAFFENLWRLCCFGGFVTEASMTSLSAPTARRGTYGPTSATVIGSARTWTTTRTKHQGGLPAAFATLLRRAIPTSSWQSMARS